MSVSLRWRDPKMREHLIAGIRGNSDGVAHTCSMSADQLPVTVS